MQNSHPIIDNPMFDKEFSFHMDPPYPSELSFWAMASDAQKSQAIKSNPDLWRTGQGKFYMDALSRVQSINAKNKYWLEVFRSEMEKAGDHVRLAKVKRCIDSYLDRPYQDREFAATAAGNQTEHETAWQE